MQRFLKRLIDIIGSLVGLIISSPIFLALSVLIKATTPGSIFFIQERVGKDGNRFRMYKFRSMVQSSEAFTLGKYITKEEEYITPLGKFLRRWAIDEIPQLINIIKGDMSIVGPRPTLQYQVEKYDERQRKRLLMKPGLTGWAQVNGRNVLTWPKRIELDVWYVENWSLLLDIKIMLRTIPALLRRDFAYAEENVRDDEIVRIQG